LHRDRTNTEAAKTFSATAEEQKIASWAKYDEHTADAVSTAGQSNVRLKRTSWHQVLLKLPCDLNSDHMQKHKVPVVPLL